MALLAVGVVGSVVGMGLQLWLEPRLTTITLAAGSLAGLLIAYGFGASLGHGLEVGGAVAIAVLAIRALASIFETLDRPPSMASPRAWFAR